MVVANNKIDETKNAGKSSTILMAMVMQWYHVGRIAQWITSRASLEATGLPYRPDDRHGRRIRIKHTKH